MASAEDILVQFRAGLMNAENKTLRADQRKGLVRLSQVRGDEYLSKPEQSQP